MDEGIFLLDETYLDDPDCVSGGGDFEETHDVAMITVEGEGPDSEDRHVSEELIKLALPALVSEYDEPPLLVTDSDSESDSESDALNVSALPRQGIAPLEVHSSVSQGVPEVALERLQFPEDVSVSRRRHRLALEAEACWVKASSFKPPAGSVTLPDELPLGLLPPGSSSWLQQGIYPCDRALCNIHAYPGHVSEVAAKGLVEPYQGA